MTTVTICERWNMDLAGPSANGKWYGDFALNRPKELSPSFTAGWWAASALRASIEYVDSVHEYFGGMGAQSLMLQELFAPTYHTVQEFHLDGVDHLIRVLPDHIMVRLADSYAVAPTPADIVSLDFGDLTAWKTREGEKHRRLIDDVFSLYPLGVMVTDIAGPRLPLQRQRYETMLGAGSCETYGSYLEAFCNRIEDLTGYVLVAGYYHRTAAKLSFVQPGIAPRGSLYPTPSTPIGLQ